MLSTTALHQAAVDTVPALLTRELIAGSWWNMYADGTRLPYIAGGADDGDKADEGKADGDKADGDKADAAGAADDGDADGGDPPGADQLGDAGKRALDEMKGKWRTERDQRKAITKHFEDLGLTPEQAATKLKEFLAGNGKDKKTDDDQVDVDTIREQARREARAEANLSRAVDKIEARAGRSFTVERDGKSEKVRFADPEDAVAFLRDKAKDYVDGDTIDTEAIDEALKELLEKKPQLAAAEATKGKKFDGDADGGARKTEEKKPASLGDAISSKYAGSTR